MIPHEICPVCDSENIRVTKEDLRQSFFGLASVFLSNVRRISCDECDSSVIEIPKQRVVIDQIRRELCWLGRPLTGSEFAFLRSSMDYSGKKFAEAIGVTNVSVSRWENDGQGIPKTTDILLRVMTLSDLGFQGSISELMLEISRSDQVDVRIDLDALMQDTSNVVRFFDPSASIVEADLNISAQSNTVLTDDTLLDSANGQT